MSLVQIPNQTVAFNYPLNDCDSCDDRYYCTPLVEGETVDFQFIQTPCGENLNCDPTFQKLSSTLVTNGDFNGSAAGWTLGGADWSYGANKVAHTATGSTTLTQAITSLDDNKAVFIRFTVGGYAGTPNGIVVTLGALNVGVFGANGTYTLYLAPTFGGTNNLVFTPDAGTAFTLDNIEIYEIIPCWDFDDEWLALEDGGLYHSSGTGTAIVSTPPLTIGKYYRVIFTVEGITDGSVQAICGSTPGTAVDEDGTYTQYITSNGTNFGFLPTTDFDGTITYAEVKLLKNDHSFGILDLDDNTEYTATNVSEYYNEFVTVRIDPQDWLPGTATCFKIVYHDQCSEYSENLVTNNMFIDGFTDWTNAANWFTSFHSAYAIAAFNATLYHTKYDDFGNPIIRTETKYKYNADVWGSFPATTGMTFYTGARTLTTFSTTGNKTGVVTVAAPLNSNVFQIGFLGDGISTTTNVYVSNIELYAITEVDTDYVSQCFKLIPSAGCTRLVEAYCDNNTMGFNFSDTGFVITQRIPIVTVNPAYPTIGQDYIFSDGERKMVTAQSEKYWTLRTEFIPEWSHDALRVMKLCDHFLIEDDEYFSKPDDYTPDYLGNNDYVRLSSVSFEIRKKTDTIFKTYCD